MDWIYLISVDNVGEEELKEIEDMVPDMWYPFEDRD